MKRWILFAVLLALLGAAASAETFCVNYSGTEESGGYALLIRDDGTPLVPAETYSNIFPLTPDDTPEAERLYGAEPCIRQTVERVPDEDELYASRGMALLDGEGRRLTDFDYHFLEYGGPGAVIFTLADGTMGAMTPSGEEILPPEFIQIRSNGEGGWLAVPANGVGPDGDERYSLVYIDPDGARHDTGLHTGYYSVGEFRDGICPISGVEEYGRGSVYVDAKGGVLFDRAFAYAEPFLGNYARVCDPEDYGLIDKSGAFFLPPEYDSIFPNDERDCLTYICLDGDAAELYDAFSGEILAELDTGPRDDVYVITPNPWMISVSDDDSDAFYSLDGSRLAERAEDGQLNAWYSRCSGMPERLVHIGGQEPRSWAELIDLDGSPVGGRFQNIYAELWQDGVGRYITRSHRVIEQDGEEIVDWRSCRYGLCDENGEVLLEDRYSDLELLSADRLWATQGDRTGMIDAHGRWYYTIESYRLLQD